MAGLESTCLTLRNAIIWFNLDSAFPAGLNLLVMTGSSGIFSHHLQPLRYKILLLVFLFTVSAVSCGWTGEQLEVSVTGVTGQAYGNILAKLRIHLFRQSGDLDEAEIRRLHRLAPQDIKMALAPYGYHSPVVEGSLQKETSGWKAAYIVETGRQVYITKLSVLVTGPGGSLPELGNPLQIISLETGQPLNHPQYDQDKRELLRKVRSLGFLNAFYSIHELRINRGEFSAEIELELDTGPRYLFGETTSDQNVLTDELFKRFIPFNQGDTFDPSLMRQLQRDLSQSNYFGQVIVEPELENTDELFVPVNVRVSPLQKYNKFSLGLGYATDTGANIRFDWENKLLNKKGHRTFSSLMIGDKESLFLFNYRVPVADPRFNTITGTTEWNRELWEDTTTEKYSAGVVYEYRTPEKYGAGSLQAFDEDYKVGSVSGRGRFLMPGLRGSLAIADDIINTRNGIRGSVDLEGASENVLSDASFLKLRVDGKAIITPLQNWRFIGRATVGSIFVDSISDLPPSLRFYAGGEKSVRGYKYRTLGPVEGLGTIVGGRFLLTSSITCERQIYDHWRVSAFYDVGNAMDDWAIDLVQGVGVGVGLALPFGQVRLELAYPLSDEGTAQYFYLRIGADL